MDLYRNETWNLWQFTRRISENCAEEDKKCQLL